MLVDKFNMVDMGGIDLVMSQGVVVVGLYQRLVDSIVRCRYQCLYNWKFNGIVIAPSVVEMTINEDNDVVINEAVTVDSDDVIHIYSLEILPVLETLTVSSNGQYLPPEGVDGYSSVVVNVPNTYTLSDEGKVVHGGELVSQSTLYIDENGEYDTTLYSEVEVDIASSEYCEIWNFLNSIVTGELNLTSLCRYSSSGPSETGFNLTSSGYIVLPFKASDVICEIDFVTSQATSSTSRILMYASGTSTTPTDGFARASNGTWGFYKSSWNYTELTDASLLDDSTIEFFLDDDSAMNIYKNGVLLAKSESGKFSGDENLYICIGASNGAAPSLIEEIRIKRKEQTPP